LGGPARPGARGVVAPRTENVSGFAAGRGAGGGAPAGSGGREVRVAEGPVVRPW